MAKSKKNIILRDLIKLLLAFWIPITALVFLGLYELSIIYFGALVFLVRVRSPLMLVSLFVYFLPMSSIIGTEYNLFGLIGFFEIVQVFFISYIIKYNAPKQPLSLLQKYAMYMLIGIAIYYLYYYTKGIIYGTDLGEDVTSINYVFKLLVKTVLKYWPLIFIIKQMGNYSIRSYVFPAITLSLITIFISMLIVDPMIEFGFYLPENEFSYRDVKSGITRAMGLYNAGGDTNSVAGFFLIAFGFFLAQYERVKRLNQFIVIFGITIMGLFLTASRTGMISLALIILVFLIRNFHNRSMFKLFFLGFIFFIFSSTLILNSIERFYADSAKRALNKDNDARLGYYYIYGNYFVEHPESLIAGYTSNPIWYKRPPHNFFLLMLYNGGIIFPGLFLFFLFKIFRKRRQTSKHLYLVYMIIPMFLILSTINSEGSATFFWLFISSVPYFYNGRDEFHFKDKSLNIGN